jgi:hypothetical protein
VICRSSKSSVTAMTAAAAGRGVPGAALLISAPVADPNGGALADSVTQQLRARDGCAVAAVRTAPARQL